MTGTLWCTSLAHFHQQNKIMMFTIENYSPLLKPWNTRTTTSKELDTPLKSGRTTKIWNISKQPAIYHDNTPVGAFI